MRVVVDTSVWSLFLRRKTPSHGWHVLALENLIRAQRVQMLGIIRQELLCGIRELAQFERLRDVLAGFPDLLASSQDHVLAAQCYNTCRQRGVQGTDVDFLICAQAMNHGLLIMSADGDFERYAEHLSIELVTESSL